MKPGIANMKPGLAKWEAIAGEAVKEGGARCKAIRWLLGAAEVEHALMVQYLYAAFTLDTTKDRDVKDWQQILLGVAKEEMGHLMTVQNLLLLIGGPPHFEREPMPFTRADDDDYYPFPFSLEKLTVGEPERIKGAKLEENWKKSGTLNRYVAAEMPLFEEIDPQDQADVRRIIAGEGGVNRVGDLYAALIEIFSPSGGGISGMLGKLLPSREHLENDDFRKKEKIEGRLADARVWDRAGEGHDVLVRSVTDREEALEALKEIAAQGEGHLPGGPRSHFKKFLDLYRSFEGKRRRDSKWTPSLPVPDNPSTESGRDRVVITHPAARLWAKLFDLRYELTLELIMHHLLIDGKDGPAFNAKRHFLADTAIREMRMLSWWAGVVMSRPLTPDEGETRKAAPPFTLPDDLSLPDDEGGRDRAHLETLCKSAELVAEIPKIDSGMTEHEQLKALHWHDMILKRAFKTGFE